MPILGLEDPKLSCAFREGTGATKRIGRLVEPWDRTKLPDLAPKGDAGPSATQQTPVKDQT